MGRRISAARMEQNAVLRYAVLWSGEAWRIFGPRRPMGYFRSREHALMAGSRLAREAQAAGYSVEFLAQAPTGELAEEDVMRWCSVANTRGQIRELVV